MADNSLLTTLRDLGYWFATDPSFATPDLRLELALREFQTDAKLKIVAQEASADPKVTYADRLVSVDVAAGELFEEPVTGIPTDRTKALLAVWTTKKYRCPVVIECWARKVDFTQHPPWVLHNGDKPFLENIWLRDEPQRVQATRRGRRMFVRDFTKRYDDFPFVKAKIDKGNRLLLGRYEDKSAGHGPVADVASHEVAAAVRPERLTGKTFDQLSREAKITFRVVRAVAETECGGFFDQVNCWDKAIVSIGLCNWTLSHVVDEDLQRGELEAFLAYLDSKSKMQAIIGDTGMRPVDKWESEKIKLSSQRKFATVLQQVTKPDGSSEPITSDPPGPSDQNRLDFLRSWHWFYRWQIALRTSEDVTLAMWYMARFRIRDILSASVQDLGIKNGAGDFATLEDVFRVEQSVILLVEWHVLKPNLFVSGKPGARLKQAIKDSGVKLNTPTNKWTANDQVKLLTSLKKVAGGEIRARFNRAIATRLKEFLHPDTKEETASASAPFVLDKTGLGPSPF